MLKSIQEMIFFLRTAFGDSAGFAGSMVEVKTQGLCQGNGAAPAGWAVVSITVMGLNFSARYRLYRVTLQLYSTWMTPM